MKYLHEATLQWAKDRQIIPNSTTPTQMLKLGSEFGELCHHLATNKSIKDDIGDCLVVLTIVSGLEGYDLVADVMTLKPTKHSTPTVPTAMHYLGLMQDKAIKRRDFRSEMRNFINQLEGIAVTRHTNLLESWSEAYEDIKDRKGHMNEEGVFIKEGDKI